MVCRTQTQIPFGNDKQKSEGDSTPTGALLQLVLQSDVSGVVDAKSRLPSGMTKKAKATYGTFAATGFSFRRRERVIVKPRIITMTESERMGPISSQWVESIFKAANARTAARP
jgi:hypothetical protein